MYATDELPRDATASWDLKLVAAFGGRPWLTAFAVAVAVATVFFGVGMALGAYTPTEGMAPSDAPSTFGLDPYTWAAIVTSLLFGYATAAAYFAVTTDWVELGRLAPALGLSVEEVRSRWLTHTQAQHPGARVAGFASVPLGIAVTVFTVPGASDLLGIDLGRPQRPFVAQAASAWFLIVMPALFYLLGKGMYFSAMDEKFFGQLRIHHLKIDVHDLDPLKPVTRMAMRRALIWIVGSTIGSLYFLSAEIERSVLLPLFLGIAGIAVVLLVLPITGVHGKIVRAKNAELQQIRAKIRDERDVVMEKRAGHAEAGQRLAGLIALESRTVAAREWPIDFSTVSRFAIILAIPLASWVGGALVERVVDTAIG